MRLERGFLIAAGEGNQSRAAVADFERCLQLCGTDLRDDELVATMVAVANYYFARADLLRVVEVLESLHACLRQGRPWLRPVIEGYFGVLAWLRGEFDAAGSHLEQAMAGLATEGEHEIKAVWFQPNEPVATVHIFLALVGLVRGDPAGAETELAQAARRADELDFPQGPFSLASVRFVEIWLRIEARQLDRAAVLAADLTDQAERHGFELLRLWAGIQQAAVSALAALGAGDRDPPALSAHIATMTSFVDTLRTVGLNLYPTFFDAVLGRLLTAAGQPEQARTRLDTALALARDTGMCFYDAELLRLRAHTHTDPDARQADIAAAIELARRQGATLFELRAALDDFELRGQPARAALADVVSRIPTNSAWPELARTHARTAVNQPEIGEPLVPVASGRAGAPGIAAAAGQRHTQTRPWYRKTWVVVAGGVSALLIAAAIAISITVTLTTGSTSSPSATAMRQWWSRASLHFQQSANALPSHVIFQWRASSFEASFHAERRASQS